MFLFFLGFFFWSLDISASSKITDDEIIREINYIESILEKNETTVENELENSLNNKYGYVITDEMLNTTSEVLDAYLEYKASNLNIESGIIMTGFFSNFVYKAAIAAILAYFKFNKYYLSYELLAHAYITSSDSQYIPKNGSIVKKSNTFIDIAQGNITSGGDFFNKGDTIIDNDLYYSIHYFTYKKSSSSSRTVTIYDTYDYTIDKNINIEGVAINLMYKAQRKNIITPYKVLIEETI